MDRVLDEAGSAAPGEGEEPASTLEGIDQAEINRLLGADDAALSAADDAPGDDDTTSAMDAGQVASLMDDAYGAGQELARLGDGTLMVADDRLRAFFRGPLPEGTTYDKVVQTLDRVGICFGIIPGHIHELLPRKKSRRPDRRRARASVEAGQGDVVVAQGQEPTPPGKPQIEYLFDEAGLAQGSEVQGLLEGKSLAAIERCAASLPLVRPGQPLARIVREPGASGRDVFGQEVPCPPPEEGSLSAGGNVSRADDGQTCTADAWGYAALIEDEITVLSPLWIAPDLMHGYFVFLPQGEQFQPPAPEDLKALLAQSAVVHGVDEAAIAALCEALASGPGERPGADPSAPVGTLLARGTDAVPGEPAHWQFAFNPKLTRYFGEIFRVFGHSKQVDYLLGYLEGLAGTAVSAGEVLAVKKPPTEGEMGRDIFGEEFMPDEGREGRLEAGEHTHISDDGTECVADIYGYVGIDQERIDLISPIWVSPDQTAAHFVNLPQLGDTRVPSYDEIDQLLERAEIRFGTDHQAIAVLCEKMAQGLPTDLIVPVARSRAPESGVDGHFDYAVEVEPQPVTFLEDGSVDFKALTLAPLLEPGQLIGANIPAQPGIPGMDIRGRELKARDGQDVAVDVGQNVRLVREKGHPDRYVAEIEGELAQVDRRRQSPPVLQLAVHETKTVAGDVDYHTGNIDYPGNVHIQGSVRAGFTVKAEGNVVVGDSLDDGARVTAGANVAVKNGIIGEKTRVAAAGGVYAKFVNEAKVRAKGEVVVSEYILNASVQSADSVSVLGLSQSPNRGMIAGGFVVAGQEIQAQRIGTESAGPTNLVAGVDPALLQQGTNLKKWIDKYQAVIRKMLRALEVESVDPAKIKGILYNLLLTAQGPRRKAVGAAVKDLVELQSRCAKSVAERKQLEQRARELALAGAIVVAGTVAVGTVLRIGEHSRVIREDASAVVSVRFSLVRQGDKVELRMASD